MDSKKRYTAKEALKSPWIMAQKNKAGDGEIPSPMQRSDHDRLVVSMRNYASYSKVKKAALMVVAYRGQPGKMKALREAFSSYDLNKTGTISMWEFREVLKEQGYHQEEVARLFDEIDEDHDGVLHYTEFLAMILEASGQVETERLEDAFDQLDEDHTGMISRENIAKFLGKDGERYNLTKLIAEVDFKGTGNIDQEEFMWLMRQAGKFSLPEAAQRPPVSAPENGGPSAVGTTAVAV
ncbi:unnamed protein product, partial [Discosporangium mesarthrocarpum]